MTKQLCATALAALCALAFILGITSDRADAEEPSVPAVLPVTQETKGDETSPDTASPEATTPDTTSPDTAPPEKDPLPLYINGRRAPAGFAKKEGEIVYLPIEGFCELLSAGKIEAEAGKPYLISEGRCIPCSTSDASVTVLDISGELCAPIEALVSASGQSLVYGASGEIIIKGTPSFPSADEVYDSEELFWLSRIISAEARGECFEGQLAVGCVVINRTEHRSFPDTIYEVIFDNKFGVQFSPAHSGSVHKTPTESSVRAAKLCLEGFSLSDSILFFFNSSLAAGSWITSNRTYTLTIGNHDFYS